MENTVLVSSYCDADETQIPKSWRVLSITRGHCIQMSSTSIHYIPKEFQCETQTVVMVVIESWEAGG